MKAVLLAGGRGERLRPLTDAIPKPMLPVFGKPFLEHKINSLMKHGIDEFVLCLHYLPEKVQTYFGDGSKLNVCIEYAIEKIPLGTGGALKNAEPYLHKTFLATNGDTHAAVDIADLVRYHTEKSAKLTIALRATSDTRMFGKVELDPTNRVVRFLEKQHGKQAGFMNIGMYVMEPELLHFIPQHTNVSLEYEVFPTLVHEGLAVYGYVDDGPFLDIGTRDAYEKLVQNSRGDRLSKLEAEHLFG